MKNKVKENVSILKLIPFVRAAMSCRGWEEDVRLSEASGVSTGVISRFLKHGAIDGENLCKVLNALGMIKTGETRDTCPIDCDKKTVALCNKVKRVVGSNTAFAGALEANINAFDESVTLKAEVENLKEVIYIGRDGGTPKVPAGCTARTQKAG